MPEILCERRTSCALNDNGVCVLESPQLDQRQAYVSCLDQINAVGVGSASVDLNLIVG